MDQRFVSIWFRYLITDWYSRRQPALRSTPFVLVSPIHNRIVITAANHLAEAEGIRIGMLLADARAIAPSLLVFDDRPELPIQLLTAIGEWCIRFTPYAAIDPPDGLILNVSGCTHLWGGEDIYLTSIHKRLMDLKYHTRLAMADTIGAAWAIAHFGNEPFILKKGEQATALLTLPPASLRLDPEIIERLHKLGLRQVKSFINMSRSALRIRFGQNLIQRLNQALGEENEVIQPVQPIPPYQERLACLEPILTSTGIEIALQRLLEMLCTRLLKEGKGIRRVSFKCYRVDNKIEQIEIGTNRASNHVSHLFKLFQLKLPTIEPALGIELFILEALNVEDVPAFQEKLWRGTWGLENIQLSELLDRITGKIGEGNIHRYLPTEHYWPERSFHAASSLDEKLNSAWRSDKRRPIQLLSKPEPVEVTAPIPDYPPMLFRYKGKLHTIKKADGPERIEREWWLDAGVYRDYYLVEDHCGCRYWLFRSGHYSPAKNHQWFIHGFFA
jgi:protein ImuB